MSTLAFAAARAAAGGHSATPSVSFLRRIFAAMIAAREVQAERLVSSYLARYSVAELRALGYSDGQIAELRKTPPNVALGWV